MLSTVENLANQHLFISGTKPPLSVPSTYYHHRDLSTMMSAEFARPLPKPKYNNSTSTSNPNNSNDTNTSNIDSLSSRSKYSLEQHSPVNLAVGQMSPSTITIQQQQQQQKEHINDEQKEIDVVGLGYSPTSRLPFPAGPSPLGTNAYQSLNYYRYPPQLFPPQFTRQFGSHRPTYIPTQMDTYHQPFLPAFSQLSSSSPTSIQSPQPQSQHTRQIIPISVGMNQNQNDSYLTHKSNERSLSSSSITSSTTSSSSPALNNGSVSLLKEKEPKSAGPKLGSSNNSNSDLTGNNFKLPSGKEGSLKHRFLSSRPFGEKDSKITRLPLSNSSLTNFTKGSLIELANGDRRRVEDLRTEDFILSAEKSTDLQLADSTVVKILNAASFDNCVIITFSYDKNRSKVDIEATLEHPFFVYGQGWASCNPEGSLHIFGLKCQRLQVGDVCISLKQRPPKNLHFLEDNMSQAPQNLSKRPTLSQADTSNVPNQYSHLYLQQQMMNISNYAPYNYSEKSMANLNKIRHKPHVDHVVNEITNESMKESPLSMVLPKSTIESDDINSLLSKKRRFSDGDMID